jgi:TPP-dependent pyruvate/acetoin dehydrogenase alpha subunit
MSTLSHASILKSGKYNALKIEQNESEIARKLLKFMLRLRVCEQKLAAEYHPADEMRCPVHFCIGQEAVPAALSVLLQHKDYLFSHHRSHGYFLAKNGPMRAMFSELYGKKTGANGGLAGSQDISFPQENFFSGAILAGATSIAMGAALGMNIQGLEGVAFAGFGESATDEGIFWETVNYAAYAKLPVIFICENNKYSVFSPQEKRSAKDNLSERVSSFGMRSKSIFGNDVMAVYRTLSEEINRARSGEGPAFIEAYTYRWNGHYGPESDDLVGYRESSELDAWKKNCPISLLRDKLIEGKRFDSSIENQWLEEINIEIDDSFNFAKNSDFPVHDDWKSLNVSPDQPLANNLLKEIEYKKYSTQQETIQIKGY